MRLKTIVSIILINFKHMFFYRLNILSKIIPYKVLIQITNDCNSRCGFCEIWKINKENPSLKERELSVDNYKAFFKNYGKNLYWLSLSGGEVTLSKNTSSIIKIAVKECRNLKLLTFTTNGLMPERALDLALMIKGLPVDHFITVSLDGDRALHDETRGVKGNYDKALRTLNLLKENGINCHFGVTLNDRNDEFISSMYKDYRDDMKAVTFVHDGGIYNTHSKVSKETILKSLLHVVRHYKVEGLSDWWERLYLKIGIKFLKEDGQKNIIPCSAGLSSIHVGPHGGISPCMFLGEYGNIKESLPLSLIENQVDSVRLAPMKGECNKCWMNCYAPHSMMMSPVKSILRSFS